MSREKVLVGWEGWSMSENWFPRPAHSSASEAILPRFPHRGGPTEAGIPGPQASALHYVQAHSCSCANMGGLRR